VVVFAFGGIGLGCVESPCARGVIVADAALCGACSRCAITCSSLHDELPGPALALVTPDASYQEHQFDDPYWMANTCRMCPEVEEDDGQLSEPACVAHCPEGAAQIAEDGHPTYGDTHTRFIDTQLCIGCGQCVANCPRSHPVVTSGKATKCDLCLAEYDSPPCVDACPSTALVFIPFWSDHAPRPFPWEPA